MAHIAESTSFPIMSLASESLLVLSDRNGQKDEESEGSSQVASTRESLWRVVTRTMLPTQTLPCKSDPHLGLSQKVMQSLQPSEQENADQLEFPFLFELQSPDHSNRQEQDQKIHDDIDNAHDNAS